MSTATEADPATAHLLGARQRARGRVLLATVLAGALVASAGVVAVVRDDRRLAEASRSSEATVRLAGAISGLAAPVADARAVLASSADRVDDEQVRADLEAALDDATTAASAADTTTERLAASRAALLTATAAVTDAVAAWELTQARLAWSHAADDLDEALAAAQAVLDSSAGRVADDAVRQSLSAAIAAARTVRDQPEPVDVAGYAAAVTSLAGAADSLGGPQTAVSDAVSAWDAAQAAAAAAEQAAAAAAAASNKKSASTTSSSGESPANESHWETTVTYEELRICGDTEGNSWEC